MKEIEVPFTVDVSIDASQRVKVRAEDIAKIRRIAEKEHFLQDDSGLLDAMNELVESRLDQLRWDYWDFDWNGVQQDDLFALIRSSNPAIIPELPGQMGLGDLTDKD